MSRRTSLPAESGLSSRSSKKKVEPKKQRKAKADGDSAEKLVKYSLYFYPDVLEKLEDTWYWLRKEQRLKVPKWRIVQVLLQNALRDPKTLMQLLAKD